jgi:hypothetical protein
VCACSQLTHLCSPLRVREHADPEDVRRLAVMKRAYSERVHAPSMGAIVAGAVRIVIGMVAAAGRAATVGSSRCSGGSLEGLGRASIALGVREQERRVVPDLMTEAVRRRAVIDSIRGAIFR